MILNEQEKKSKLTVTFVGGDEEIYDDKSYIIVKDNWDAKKRANQSMLNSLSDILKVEDGLFGKKYLCTYCESKLYGKIVIRVPKVKLYKTPPPDAKKDVKKLINKGYAFKLDYQVICPNCGREREEISGFFYYT